MAAPVLRVRSLRKTYGPVVAVDGISFDVGEGEIFGILGPNGAGKTTTLEVIEGLRRPDSGDVEIDGLDAVHATREAKRRIGVQLQATALFDYLKVRETVNLFASFYGRRVDAERLLERVQLRDKADAYVPALSGGQRQRLSIGLALVNEPRVVFLDEPTTGLDPQARHNIWDVVAEMRNHGITVVITTHYMEEAEVLCDRIAIMDAGRIIALDTAFALIRSLGTAATIELDSAGIPLDRLRSLPTVTRAEASNGRALVLTETPERVLTDLLALSRMEGFGITGLRVRGGTLEDVFLSLTGRSIRE